MNFSKGRLLLAAGVLFFCGSASAQNKVVVVPLGGDSAESFFTELSPTSISYQGDIDFLAGTSARINMHSSSNVFQFSAEGTTFTLRDDGAYRLGYYGDDEWGPTNTNQIDLGSASYRWRTLFTNNPVDVASDRRLKKNIVPASYGLDAVLQLSPVQYQWKEGDQKEMLGFIAQDVESVVPTVVRHQAVSAKSGANDGAGGRGGGAAKNANGEGSDVYSMSYSQLIPVLTKAIQELAAKNDELSARLDALER